MGIHPIRVALCPPFWRRNSLDEGEHHFSSESVGSLPNRTGEASLAADRRRMALAHFNGANWGENGDEWGNDLALVGSKPGIDVIPNRHRSRCEATDCEPRRRRRGSRKN